MDWLGGTVRRWVSLMGGLVTLAGIAIFAATEHIAWAWLAIAVLLALVASLALTARDEHGKRLAAEGQGQGTPNLDRLISEGRALNGPDGVHEDEWQAWRRRARSQVLAQFGLRQARAFSRAGSVSGPAEHRQALEDQVSFLEGLRERP
jgi:hypothetical protein